MSVSTVGKAWEGPIFLLADDDHKAADCITSLLYPETCYLVPVTNPRHVLKFAKRLRPHAVFLAEPLLYPKGGAPALLKRLIEEVARPVIILTELWSADACRRWKSLGAADCLPHPTRSGLRLELLRSLMQEIALATVPVPGNGSGRLSGRG